LDLNGFWRSRSRVRASRDIQPSPARLSVRGLVIDAEGQVFLIRYTYTPGWHLPGGEVIQGESSVMALARELEENGNILVSGKPQLHGLFFNERSGAHVACYVIRDFRRTETSDFGRSIAEASFFAPDRLPDVPSRATRERLDEILSGQPIAATW
jgi:8-oxo-dGTP pyrophosphatase MutT (NUDIX family)